ncbi:MAG: hypothetical protein JJU00_06925 [Opitutales bacterium]|nr:hypothetical protein [Opitutales bacterium]
MPKSASKPPRTPLENIYAWIANEEDARVCRDISDKACREVPGNFFAYLAANACTKVGDAIANAKTTLPWALGAMGAPVALVGMLVPVRESGSLLPQLGIAVWVRRQSIRKTFWILGSLGQAASLALMALAVLTLEGRPGGIALLAALAAFSLCRGLASVASKDVLGKTIPKRRRGHLSGWTEAVAGVLVVGVSLLLYFLSGEGSARLYAGLLGIAAVLWVAGAGLFTAIREFPGETDGGKSGLREAFGQITLLRDDKPFRRFVIVRSLLLCSALTAPFFIVLSRETHGDSMRMLALFILANGIASSLSAPLWGSFADRSSRRVMQAAAVLTATVAATAALSYHYLETLAAATAWYPFLFGVLGIAHAGVRLGRKTYLVDLGSGNKRTAYVAVSNTLIGVILLFTGLLTSLLAAWSPVGAILTLSALGLGGAFLAASLPEVQKSGA